LNGRLREVGDPFATQGGTKNRAILFIEKAHQAILVGCEGQVALEVLTERGRADWAWRKMFSLSVQVV
jgi:hypothetical protein